MELSNLKSAPGARKPRKRVGRGPGSGSGKTAGRGHKGQKSRAGNSRRATFEGGQTPLNRRLPKRGFFHQSRFPSSIVNLDNLEQAFNSGDEVSPETLVKAGLADPEKGGVKILGRGELTKRLTVKTAAISAGARAKIEAAGGTVVLLESEKKKPAKKAPAPVKEAVAKEAPAKKAPAKKASEKKSKPASRED
ncbi:MAG: 50S ribosomal protein L15 [Candidatus Hydrogenedentes bacterium]|nr:50S ribosomal protein L15 [Candidatus Hydrogenedentota bacterium]